MKTLNSKFSDYFNKVYIINLVNRPDRKKFVENELKSIGIYDDLVSNHKLEWVEAIKLPITQKALDCMYQSGDIDFCYADRKQKVGQFMCASEHYRVIKKSIYKGYERILILEDDVCIIKKFEYIMKALEQAPDDFQILHLEGFYWPESDEVKQMYIDALSTSPDEGKWLECTKIKLWCTAALIYSREGMERYCREQEQKFISPDHPTFWFTERSYAYSFPLIIQENKIELNSDINEYGSGVEDVNVYLTYYNYSDYYHPKDF